ncbi:hypothetical protein CDL15_Pgr005875 [Punica granatum]|uniref:Uncharacterized protein n=1 Tax=Punica granatum TaxID=22663 RepID=A0A218WFS9_PUNGR|nr:hypothetical protein CDL15_Pgr005875 [Punica granatum]
MMGEGWPAWPVPSVFRMLLPPQKLDGLLRHDGEHIEKLFAKTGAHIRIVDDPFGMALKVVYDLSFYRILPCKCKLRTGIRGATVTIKPTRGVPEELTVKVRGNA